MIFSFVPSPLTSMGLTVMLRAASSQACTAYLQSSQLPDWYLPTHHLHLLLLPEALLVGCPEPGQPHGEHSQEQPHTHHHHHHHSMSCNGTISIVPPRPSSCLPCACPAAEKYSWPEDRTLGPPRGTSAPWWEIWGGNNVSPWILLMLLLSFTKPALICLALLFLALFPLDSFFGLCFCFPVALPFFSCPEQL